MLTQMTVYIHTNHSEHKHKEKYAHTYVHAHTRRSLSHTSALRPPSSTQTSQIQAPSLSTGQVDATAPTQTSQPSKSSCWARLRTNTEVSRLLENRRRNRVLLARSMQLRRVAQMRMRWLRAGATACYGYGTRMRDFASYPCSLLRNVSCMRSRTVTMCAAWCIWLWACAAALLF